MNSLPFSREQFFEVFARYNDGVMPLQLGLFLLALSALGALVVRRRGSDRVVSAILAALWAWMGVVYHFLYFAAVNPAAPLFGIMFLVGAGMFAWAGVVRGRLAFNGENRARRITGHVLIVYSLVVYPLLSVLLGREYPGMPTFGLPCPTTIFTIGMLAFLSTPFPRAVLIVPLAWTVIGGEAAFLLGVHEDVGLIAAGLAGAWLAFDLPRQEKPA
jgi:hypothetical protein